MQHPTESTPIPDAGIVNEAEAALRAFGTELDVAAAARLLPMWHHSSELTSAEAAAVLLRFASPAETGRGEADSATDSDLAEAFRLGTEIWHGKYMETALAVERVQLKLNNAETARRKAYADGYVDALDGRQPLYRTARGDEHGGRRWSDGLGGYDIQCDCGWRTKLHRGVIAAVDEIRGHMGQAPARPDLHPLWCEYLWEETACDTHGTVLGSTQLDDGLWLMADLNDSGPGRGLILSLFVYDADGQGVSERRDVEVPLPGRPVPRRPRAKHAFTVERTAGDHFVWTCRCGHIVVQDGDTADVTGTLREHATGVQR